MADQVARMHESIEIMTRKLELEKRRLHRLDQELISAKKTHQAKTRPRPPSRGGPEEVDGRLQRSTISSSIRSSTPDGAALPNRSAARRSQSARASTRSESRGDADLCCEDTPQLIRPEDDLPMATLVHRLAVQRQHLDHVTEGNVVLHREIDEIRQRRITLNRMFEKLKADIKRRTAVLADFVEETAASKNVHGALQQRVAFIKRQREIERNRFKADVMRLRQELKQSEWEKKEAAVQLKRPSSKYVQRKHGLIMPEEEGEFAETAIMRRIMKTAFLNCIQRRHIKEHQRSIAVFESAFATIKQSTGISNIEEIVKIFVNLESRNYSLLTYVNHMNREIEELESLRRERRTNNSNRVMQEQKNEIMRQDALAETQQTLRAVELAAHYGRAAHVQHSEVFQKVQPLVGQIADRISSVIASVKRSGARPGEDTLPNKPSNMHETTIPAWLDWLEQGLGRFRDLLPAEDSKDTFPVTAAAGVKQLTLKRPGAQVLPQPLVKSHDLPISVSSYSDEGALSKGAHLSQAQKTAMAFEEEEEEDFGDRPLLLKDLRDRAGKSVERHRKVVANKGIGDRKADTSFMPGRGKPGPPAGDSSATAGGLKPSRGELATFQEDDEDEDGEKSSGSSGTKESIESGSANGENEATGSTAPARENVTAMRQAAKQRRQEGLTPNRGDSGPVNEVTDEELNQTFLRRYNMSRAELSVMADRLGIHLSNLCFLKQEFDHYDEDQSGYIDSRELHNLLSKLGEELSDGDLAAAFRQLDADGSGEIEFFEFVDWFTAGS